MTSNADRDSGLRRRLPSTLGHAARDVERKPVSELRDPLSYASVGEWFEDYHGYVPIQMAHALSEYVRRTGATFPEAYARLRAAGAIVELGNGPASGLRVGQAGVAPVSWTVMRHTALAAGLER